VHTWPRCSNGSCKKSGRNDRDILAILLDKTAQAIFCPRIHVNLYRCHKQFSNRPTGYREMCDMGAIP